MGNRRVPAGAPGSPPGLLPAPVHFPTDGALLALQADAREPADERLVTAERDRLLSLAQAAFATAEALFCLGLMLYSVLRHRW